MNQSASLDFLFHPRSIAIAGVSENANKFNFGKRYLQGLIEFGFPGKIYPLNPAGGRSGRHPPLQKPPGDSRRRRLHHFGHSRPLYAEAGR